MGTRILPKIVIQNSTIGLGECMALLLCVFYSGGHLHWFWTDLWEKQRFHPLMLVVAAIFVLPAIVILRRQFDRSPQLIISPQGLDLRRSSAFFAGRFKISRFKSSRFKSRHRRPQRFIAWNKMRGKKIDFATLFNGRSPPNQWLIIYTDQGALLSLLNFMQHKDNLQEWLRTIASAPDEAERAALILKIKREYELWLP